MMVHPQPSKLKPWVRGYCTLATKLLVWLFAAQTTGLVTIITDYEKKNKSNWSNWSLTSFGISFLYIVKSYLNWSPFWRGTYTPTIVRAYGGRS